MSDSTTFDRFENAEVAASTIAQLITQAGRDIAVHSRQLEPAIWENSAVLEALRTYLTDPGPRALRVLVDEPGILNARNTHFLALAQRLSSRVLIREPDPDHEQLDYETLVTDRDGLVKWDIGARVQGEFAFAAPAPARLTLLAFNRVWERARTCAELRALGI